MADVRARSSLDPSGFNAGINGMNQSVSRFGSGLASVKSALVGFLSVRAIAGASRAIIDLGSEIYHNALQANMSVESYQALAEMYEHAGGSAETLAKVAQRLTSLQGRAAGGDKTALRGLQNLGLAYKDIAGLNADRMLERIAQAQKTNGNSAEWAYGMYDVFGDRLSKITSEVLPGLADGLDNLIAGMQKSGRIMDTETAAMLASAQDMWSDFFKTIKIWGAEAYTFLVNKLRIGMGGVMAMVGGRGFGAGMQEQRDAIAEEKGRAQRDYMAKLRNQIGGGGMQEQLKALKARESELKGLSPKGFASDQLTKIGAAGGGTDVRMAIFERNVKVSEQIRDLQQQQVRLQERIASASESGGGLGE